MTLPLEPILARSPSPSCWSPRPARGPQAKTWAVEAKDAPWPPAPPFERPAERAGSLPASVVAESLGSGRWRVRFVLDSTVSAERVFLAGSFSGWDAQGIELARGADGRWAVVVELDSGRHLYKFVLDGERWIPDPLNQQREGDGHGGSNTILALGAEGGGAIDLEDTDLQLLLWRHDPTRPVHLQRLGEDGPSSAIAELPAAPALTL